MQSHRQEARRGEGVWERRNRDKQIACHTKCCPYVGGASEAALSSLCVWWVCVCVCWVRVCGCKSLGFKSWHAYVCVCVRVSAHVIIRSNKIRTAPQKVCYAHQKFSAAAHQAVSLCVSEVLLLPFNILIEVPALKMHAYPWSRPCHEANSNISKGLQNKLTFSADFM